MRNVLISPKPDCTNFLMTKRRWDQHSTEFGLWLRDQPDIDSSLGFVATNVDFIWRNYHDHRWLMLEEKRHGSSCPRSQLESFRILHQCALSDPHYHGFHLLTFEKTSPEDGSMKLNFKTATLQDLIKLLSFKIPASECRKNCLFERLWDTQNYSVT